MPSVVGILQTIKRQKLNEHPFTRILMGTCERTYDSCRVSIHLELLICYELHFQSTLFDPCFNRYTNNFTNRLFR